MRRILLITAVLVVLILVATGSATAAVPGLEQDHPVLSSRWGLQIGGFLMDLDTSVAASFDGFLGTFVNLEEVLRLEEHQNTLRLDGFYRIKAKHTLEFNLLQIHRQAATIITDPLAYEDVSFLGSVESRFNLDQLRLSYRYSFINTGEVDAGIAGGLSWFWLEGAISGDAVVEFPPGTVTPIGAGAAGEQLLAPVPSFGIFIDFAPVRWFVLQVSADFLDLDIGSLEGQFQDTRLTFDFFFTRHVGVGLGINNTNLEYRDRGSQPFQIDFRYSGVLFYLGLAF